MNILCIETSSGDGTLALQCGGQTYTAEIAAPKAQARELLPQIDALLERGGTALRQLDAIGFGRGPGSFIGVRLATGVAQGLAAAAGIGIAPVSSMAALAQQLAPPPGAAQRVIVCLDARMREVYWAEYRCDTSGVTEMVPERLLAPHAVQWPSVASGIAAGSGFAEYVELREAARSRGFALFPQARPAAVDLLSLVRAAVSTGSLVAPAQWSGSYLRDETAWKTTQ